MTQEAFMRSLMDKVAPVVKVKQMLKRKVGYTHEEMLITCAKLEVMEISRDKETSKKGMNDSNEEMDKINGCISAK